MKEIFKALSKFQNLVPVIHKGTQGYGYSYAELSKIIPIINPILAECGLSYTQLGEGTKIVTVICHWESGETLESEFDIPQGVQLKGMNDFQVMGSAITYIRRYALSSALGLITDKDLDASGTQIRKGKESSLESLKMDFKGISDKLKNCNSIEDLKILHDTLEEEEKQAYKPLFSKRRSEIK